MKSQVTNSCYLRPILENQGLAVVGVVAVIGCVASLLVFGGPSAIACGTYGNAVVACPARITTIRVNPVDRMIECRGLSHIPNKCGWVASPSIANEAANRTVKSVVVTFWVVASSDHFLPNTELPLIGESVFCVWRASTDGVGVSNEVVGAKPSFQFAFNAANKPVPSTGAIHFRGQQQKRAYNIARLNITGAKASLLVSHDVTLPNRVALRLEPAGVSAPCRLVLFYDLAGSFSMRGSA